MWEGKSRLRRVSFPMKALEFGGFCSVFWTDFYCFFLTKSSQINTNITTASSVHIRVTERLDKVEFHQQIYFSLRAEAPLCFNFKKKKRQAEG